MRRLTMLALAVFAYNASARAQDQSLEAPRDPSRSPLTGNEFAPDWFYGGRLQIDVFHEEDFDLDADSRDRVMRLRPQARGTVFYDGNKLSGLVTLNFSHREFFVDQDSSRDNVTDLILDEVHLTVKNVVRRLDVTLGRFQLKDERNFLYQRVLDGIRFDYRWQRGSAYFTVNSRDVFPRNLIDEPEQDRVINYIFYADQEVARGHKVAGYFVLRDNTDVDKDRPIFLGLRASGKLAERLTYWGEFSVMRGTTPDAMGAPLKNRGVGFDLGGTFEFDAPLRPSLSLSFAMGGGDGNSADSKNKTFRQTGIGGLAQNRGILNGTTFFNYYGELLQPNLSNIAIVTVVAAFRPWAKSSVELIFHNYRQDVAAPSLGFNEDPEFVSGLDPSPNGMSHDVGREIDLIAGYKEIPGLELELALSVFFPGQAFDAKDNAYQGKIRVKYNF